MDEKLREIKEQGADVRRAVLTEDYREAQGAKRFLLFYVEGGALRYDPFDGIVISEVIGRRFGRFLAEDCDWLRDFILNARPGECCAKLARGFAIVRES